MTSSRAAVLVTLAGFAGVAAACVLAPEYLSSRGFPLDDAWIHSVYGRSLARGGMLAYNPGIPATGATSPLWAVVMAVPHLLTSRPAAMLLGVKLIGLALHFLTAFLLLWAFAWRGRVEVAAVVGCMLVAFHSDLVSASMSGMEVALATAVAAGLLLAARRAAVAAYGLLSLVAPLARPELTLLCFAIPVLLLVRRDHRRLVALIGATAVGNALAYGAIGVRNLAVSGLPLPATFYAKAGVPQLQLVGAQIRGFSELLGRLPVVDSSILLLITALIAVGVVGGRRVLSAPVEDAAAALLAGLLFCVASFALVAPVDPRAFYHQRYVLPALPLMVVAIPVLVSTALTRRLAPVTSRLVQFGLLAVLVLSVLVAALSRYPALSNDALNIDDVQVRLGQSLAMTGADQVVWAIDAGAVRYFGNAFVVDLIGLNNAEILGPHAQRFLDDHPPRYIEIMPLWSSVDADSGRQLTAAHFRTSTPYTVTSAAPMHEHWLVSCHDPAVAGRLAVRNRIFAFRCAGTGKAP